MKEAETVSTDTKNPQYIGHDAPPDANSIETFRQQQRRGRKAHDASATQQARVITRAGNQAVEGDRRVPPGRVGAETREEMRDDREGPSARRLEPALATADSGVAPLRRSPDEKDRDD